MPTSEPLPDAPEFIAAGNVDMQVFFDRIGMGWLVPYMPAPIPRLVVTEELCALPPPAAVPFTLLDVVSMQTGDDAAVAARQKLAAWVDAGLWQDNCHYVDAAQPDPPTPHGPPADLPDPMPTVPTEAMITDLWVWVNWMRRQVISRTFLEDNTFTASGTGSTLMPAVGGGDWLRYAAGVRIEVLERPDTAGRSNGGAFPVFYDLGWFSLGDAWGANPPIRLQHQTMLIYGCIERITTFWWNLPPGVEISVTPLYPETKEPTE